MSETCNHRGEHSIVIFGVRLTEGTNNNITTNNNQLSEYQQPPPQVSTTVDASYVSNIHAPDRSRKCKRGVPWTEEEQKLFLLGLQELGKGDWKGISRKFVKMRTPIQVASHAQKHFLHRPNQNRRRKKLSVFDLTIETVLESSTIMEDEQIQQEIVLRPVPLPQPTPTADPSTYNGCIPDSRLPTSLGPVALSVLPISRWVDLNDNGCSSFTNTFPLSLKLQSLAPSDDHSPESSGHSSPPASSLAFNSMSAGKSSGGSRDNITDVHVAC